MLHALYRRGYYLAMYSGVRAMANRMRSRRAQLPARLAVMDGTETVDSKLGELLVRVHGRAAPARERGAHHGILSLRQVQPQISRWIYRLLCSTSHFGCGHVEVAFFERNGVVTLYAVRNIASANARRIGLRGLAARMRLIRAGEAARTLHCVAGLLAARGYAVQHASPEHCLALTVDERLIAAARRPSAQASLRRKYERLQLALSKEPA